MKPFLLRFKSMRIVSAALLACTLLLSSGLTVFAAEEGSPDLQETMPPLAVTTALPTPAEVSAEPTQLYPADVQTMIDGGTRQIVKIYILTAEQRPADIPRDSFDRDGWRYTLVDITEKRTSSTNTRSHTETVEINTENNDLNAIIKQLSPMLEYEAEDGYHGILKLDIASVNCEVAGHKNSSYTVSATREYPHLSTNDLSLIPKTITDNGRTLQLDTVSWEAQQTVNVDYHDIPSSYRAVAKYTASASRSVVTGYITTAEYSGEITNVVTGDTVYTAFFEGKEINPLLKPMPTPIPTPSPTAAPEATETPQSMPLSPAGNNALPLTSILICLAVLAALGGAVAFFFLRRNVKIYRDGFRVLAARDKINAKSKLIDLSPLDGESFGIEIDKFTAKSLNGQTIEVKHGPSSLKHKIAYEGNSYRVEVDFGANMIRGIY